MKSPQRSTSKEVLNREICEQQMRLVQANGDAAGRAFPIEMGETLVGAGSQSAVVIDDRSVSRRHCVIERSADAVRVKDLGSTNGTAVDGVPIEAAFLRAGSKLRVGNVVLAMEVGYKPLELGDGAARRGFRGLVGNTPPMRSVFAARDRLAGTDVTVLIHGETGTGKSALARSIHGASKRRHSPFIVFDCGSLAPTLIESSLFGHEQGAFTGADRQKIGLLEAAQEGTLFIDELGELPQDLQPKLLRALEDREFLRVGGHKPLPVKCRIIAASQESVWSLVERGEFRQDLYFRLAVVTVPLPPLRDRKEDIPALVNQLYNDMGMPGRDYSDFDEQTRADLAAHSWPGNIRELRNFLERRASVDDQAQVVSVTSSAETRRATTTSVSLAGEVRITVNIDEPYRELKQRGVDAMENAYFSALLERCKYNVSEVSRKSGVNRRHVHELLAKHRLGRSSG